MGKETSLLQGNSVVIDAFLSESVRIEESRDYLCVHEPGLLQHVNLCVICGAIRVTVVEISGRIVAIVHNEVRSDAVGVDSRIVLHLNF